MSVQVARIVSIVVLSLGTFLCGVLPSLVTKRITSQSQNVIKLTEKSNWMVRKSHYVTSFLMCVGGGILFSTCFMHLLPEVNHSFEDWWHDDERNSSAVDHEEIVGHDDKNGHQHKHHFPLPQFVVCCGFLFIFTFEEILKLILFTINKRRRKIDDPSTTATPETTQRDDKDLLSAQQHVRVYGTIDSCENRSTECHRYSSDVNSMHASYDSHVIELKNGLSFTGLLIVTALSFHSLFEGLSVGLQDTERATWTMLFAISMHKFVIAMVIGIEAVEDGSKLKVLIPYMIVFSIMSPLGIITASIAERSLLVHTNLIEGVLNGLATGTLLYVTFFEVMHKEKNSNLPGMFQLFGLILGFLSMTIIDRITAKMEE